MPNHKNRANIAERHIETMNALCVLNVVLANAQSRIKPHRIRIPTFYDLAIEYYQRIKTSTLFYAQRAIL